MTRVFVKFARDDMITNAPLPFETPPVVKQLKNMLSYEIYHDVLFLSMRVYASLAAFEAGQELANNQSLVGYGDEENPLVVWIPPSAAALAPTSPPPHPHPNDSTEEWTLRFGETRLSADALPSVSQLPAFVEAALPVKIPLTSTAFSSFSAAASKVVDKLFTVDDAAPCSEFYMDVVRRALKPTRGSRTETSMIAYWSSLIQEPLMSTVRHLRFDRNTNHHSSTAMQRPDFVSILHRVCVFRGEEKASDADIEVPREELRSKLIWTYGAAPYILAYATSGYECAVYALVAGVNRQVDTVEIASFHTENEKDRLRLLLTLLQLTRLFEGIVSRCPDAARDEYCDIIRPNDVVIRLNPSSVQKRFPPDARWAGIGTHLENVYLVIRNHGVPHTDVLTRSNVVEQTFVFQPRGSETKPKNLDELFIAIHQVLECLVALHKAGWMHRDLRWANVIKRRDVPNQWFLIDFVDAAPSPKENSPLEILNTRDHAPEIFIDGGSHTTAVDVWGVGALITTCDFDGEQWRDSGERLNFLFRLLATEPAQRPSASEAMAELVRLNAARINA